MAIQAVMNCNEDSSSHAAWQLTLMLLSYDLEVNRVVPCLFRCMVVDFKCT